jgi:C4-dicarboxylate-specific signal transduction histidine kinase
MRLDRVDFEVDLEVPGPQVLGEPGRVQQVVINLVNNARDALTEHRNPERGAIGRIEVRIEVDPADGNAVLTVQDDGPGIPEKVMPRLFEPFFTTKPSGKGTGLGLSISSEIVREMNGTIAAANRLQGGAVFRMNLPAVG